MAKIINLSQIREVIEKLDPVMAIEEGFVAYSKSRVVVPPVGELIIMIHPVMHI